MSTLPDYIDFGAFRAKLTLDPAIESEGDVHGDYSFNRQPEVRIAGWGTEEDASVLLHEIFHFMSDCMGLKLKEADVRRLEFSFALLFRDNPGLIHALLEGFTSTNHRYADPSTSPSPDPAITGDAADSSGSGARGSAGDRSFVHSGSRAL